MNMRSLNTFARGMSEGIGAGSTLANRKKLTELAVAEDARSGEKLGLLKAADNRAEASAREMTELMKSFAPELWKKLYGMPEAPGEGGGSFQGSAVPAPTTYTKSPTPDAQSFMAQQPQPFGRQRTLPAAPFVDWITGG